MQPVVVAVGRPVDNGIDEVGEVVVEEGEPPRPRLRQRRSVQLGDGGVVCKVEADVVPPPGLPLRLRQRRLVQLGDGVEGVEGVIGEDIPDGIVGGWEVDVGVGVGVAPLRLRQRRSVHPAAAVLEDAEVVVVKDDPDGIVVVWKVELEAPNVDIDVAPPPRMPLRLRQKRSVHPPDGVKGVEGVIGEDILDKMVVVWKVELDDPDVNVDVEPPPGLPLRLRQRRSVHPAAAVLEEVVDVVAELVGLPDKLVDEFPAVLELPTSLRDMVAGVGDAIWLGEFDVVAPPPLSPPNPKLRQSNPEQPALEACNDGEEVLLLVEDVVVVLLGVKVEVTVVTILPETVTVLTEILRQAAPLHGIVPVDAAASVVVEENSVVVDAPLPPPRPSERQRSPLQGEAEEEAVGDIAGAAASVVVEGDAGVVDTPLPPPRPSERQSSPLQEEEEKEEEADGDIAGTASFVVAEGNGVVGDASLPPPRPRERQSSPLHEEDEADGDIAGAAASVVVEKDVIVAADAPLPPPRPSERQRSPIQEEEEEADGGIVDAAASVVKADVIVAADALLPSPRPSERHRSPVHEEEADGGIADTAASGVVEDTPFPPTPNERHRSPLQVEEAKGGITDAAALVAIAEGTVVVDAPISPTPNERHRSPLQVEEEDGEIADTAASVIIAEGTVVEDAPFPPTPNETHKSPVHEEAEGDKTDTAAFVVVADGTVVADAPFPLRPNETHRSPLQEEAEGDITVARLAGIEVYEVLKTGKVPVSLRGAERDGASVDVWVVVCEVVPEGIVVVTSVVMVLVAIKGLPVPVLPKLGERHRRPEHDDVVPGLPGALLFVVAEGPDGGLIVAEDVDGACAALPALRDRQSKSVHDGLGTEAVPEPPTLIGDWVAGTGAVEVATPGLLPTPSERQSKPVQEVAGPTMPGPPPSDAEDGTTMVGAVDWVVEGKVDEVEGAAGPLSPRSKDKQRSPVQGTVVAVVALPVAPAVEDGIKLDRAGAEAAVLPAPSERQSRSVQEVIDPTLTGMPLMLLLGVCPEAVAVRDPGRESDVADKVLDEDTPPPPVSPKPIERQSSPEQDEEDPMLLGALLGIGVATAVVK